MHPPVMEILYEDNHLIVVNKRPSELVQGDRTGDIPLADHVKSYLKEKYGKPGKVFLGVIHRIDRPVSGAVIFARTGKALARMNELFRDNGVKKIYWAVTAKAPEPDAGILEHFLRKDGSKNKSFVCDASADGAKLARLSYRSAGRSDRYFLIEVELLTGRHHQIRCQLAAAGCPVKGDLKYGFSRSNKDGSISLHARSLSFIHPVRKEKIVIEAPPPADRLWDVLTGNMA